MSSDACTGGGSRDCFYMQVVSSLIAFYSAAAAQGGVGGIRSFV